MNKFLISIVCSALLLAQTVAAAPAKLLGPDAAGRPKIKIMDPGNYYIFHSFDGAATTCDPAFYTTVTDSAEVVWCRTINRYPKNATLADPVQFAATRLNSPIEIEYRVGTSPDIELSQYVGWSPKKCVADDRIQVWLGTIQSRYNIVFQDSLATLAGQITTSNAKGAVENAEVAYLSTFKTWHFYYNDKYIALFNHQGGLVALTNTAYGDDMINPFNRLPYEDGNGVMRDDVRGYLLAVNKKPVTGTELVGGGDITSYSLNTGDGSFTMVWDTFHEHTVTIKWLLSSRSTAAQPSGLAGHANVVQDGPDYQPQMLYFPVLAGLTTGAGKQTYIPSHNSGWAQPSGIDETHGTGKIEGTFPTAKWQSQFLAVTSAANNAMLISANDPKQQVKDFIVSDYDEHTYSGTVAGMTLLAFSRQNGSATTIDTSGTVTLSPMHGDWVAAATKYGNWAGVQELWGADGNSIWQTNTAKDIDPILKKGVYWWTEPTAAVNQSLRPTAFVEDANIQKKIIGKLSGGGGVTTGFHVYSWWDKAFDTNYPQFNPTTDGTTPIFPSWVPVPSSPPTVPMTWADSIYDVQYDDSLVMPYINGAGIDISNAPNTEVGGIKRDATKPGCASPVDTSGNGWWGKGFPMSNGSFNLDDIVLRKRDGTPYTGSYGSKCRTFMFADVGSIRWLTVLSTNMDEVFNTFDSKGIYLDSLATADDFYDREAWTDLDGSSLDFASGPAGRGDWVQGSHRNLGWFVQYNTTQHSDAGVRKFVALEHFSELMVPFVDIVMDYHDPKPDELPIIQATYGDHLFFAGQRPDAYASFVTKKAIVGRSFVWGNQLGLSWYQYYCGHYSYPSAERPSTPCVDSGSLSLFDYTRTLALARQEVQDLGLEWSKAKFIGMFDGAGTEFEYRNDEDLDEPQDDWCFRPGSEVTCPAMVPQLRGALWSSTGTDEPDFLVLTNTAEVDKTASFALPRSWASRTLVYGSASVTGTSITLSGSSVAVFKAVPVTSLDTDGDGSLDSADNDDDNDGVPDSSDAFPRNSSASVDTDNNGKPDAWNSGCDAACQGTSGLTLDPDVDHDGVLNGVDNCPTVANTSQIDIDSNGVGDICQHGLTVNYFNDSDTVSPAGIYADDAKLVAPAILQRIAANINFNYGISVSPASGVNHDYFSARFTGRLIVPAYTGDYEFCLTGDDGVRLWINNINLWGDEHWRAQDSDRECATVSLVAGQSVPIIMEFFDLTEEAIAKLEWSWSGHAEEVVPTTSLYAQ